MGSSGLKSPLVAAVAPAAGRVAFEQSIAEVPVGAPLSRPHRVRDGLTPGELAEPRNFVVSLRMKNLGDLHARIRSRQIVPQAEMESSYLPDRADFEKVAAWLEGQGFTLTLADPNHTHLFARGTVAQIAAAFDMTFARVATGDGEFTSAVTPPSLPSEIAGPVLAIDGLQPHLLMHAPKSRPAAVTNVAGYFTPADIQASYAVPTTVQASGGLQAAGLGQTIAVIMDAVPLSADLSAFWQAAATGEATGAYGYVPLFGGPSAGSQSASASEVTLDAEWATAMAPGAKVIVYAIPDLGTANILAACTQILADAAANSSLRVASYSGCGPESQYPAGILQQDSQTFAQLAAAGITFLACAGDGGSNPNPLTENSGYNASNPVQVEYPASDPFVTGVGGTTITFNSNWTATAETAWTPGALGTGGGISGSYRGANNDSFYFAKPSWQSGPGVPAGVQRCVPDVAAVANANTPTTPNVGALIVLNNQYAGQIGTSLATPVWAGIAAILNQSRANLGKPALGLLGPWVYPLIATGAFQDIATGNNGAYKAGVGYDLCTGVGTPNVAKLLAVVTAYPTFTSQPVSETIAPGSTVVFSAAATGAASYQWMFNGVAITGATTSRLVVGSAGVANAGSYTLVASMGNASTSSAPAILAVTSTSNVGRLINLSVYASLPAAQGVTLGFFTGGSGTAGTQTLLVRGMGPSLQALGVSNPMADPTLTLNQGVTGGGSSVLTSNSGWGTPASNLTAVNAADAATGAFAPGSTTSHDAALVAALAPGGYTSVVASASGGAGTVLAEVYDDTGAVAPSSPRLINLSCNIRLGAASSLTAGFIVGGATAKTVLIRATGPTLATAPFNLSGTMPDPQIALHTTVNGADTVLASNAGWGGDPQITAVDNSVGAFGLSSATSKDSVVLMTLPPGAYTAVASSVSGAAGLALVEVYEVP